MSALEEKRLSRYIYRGEGICGRDFVFRKQKNTARSETLESEEGTVYGLTDFDEQIYYKY